MAWSIVGVGAVVETVTGTLTLTEPAGVQPGDLLVACIAARGYATTATFITRPANWLAVNSVGAANTLTTTSAVASAAMAYIVRGASAPSFAFTLGGTASVAIGRVVAYRGVLGAAPLDVNTLVTTAINTTAVSVAGLTTTAADDLIVAMVAGGQEAAWSNFNATTPAGASGATDTTTAPSATWRERADTNTATGADTSLAIFDALKTTAGATGNLTATASLGASHVVIAAAFKSPNAIVALTGQTLAASQGTVGAVSWPFTDNFNRPNENLEASPNWTRSGGVAGAATVLSNRFSAANPATPTAYFAPDTGTANHYVQHAVVEISNDSAIYHCCRFVDSNNFIGLRRRVISFVQGWEVYSCNAGVLTLEGSITGSISAGDVFRLECFDSTWRASLTRSGTVQSFAHGVVPAHLLSATKTGVHVYGSTGTFDNFETGFLFPQSTVIGLVGLELSAAFGRIPYVEGVGTWDSTLSSFVTLSDGDRTATETIGFGGKAYSETAHTTGKYYVELDYVFDTFRYVTAAIGDYDTGDYIEWDSDGYVYGSGDADAGVPSFETGAIISIAVDLDLKLIWFRDTGGAWLGGGDPAAGTGGYAIPVGLTEARVLVDISLGFVRIITGPNSNFGIPAGFAPWDPGAPTGNVTVTLAGQAATTAVGTLSVDIKLDVSTTLTGIAATSSPGTLDVVVRTNVTTVLTGQSAAASLGSLTVTGRTVVALDGQAANASLGTLTTSARQNTTNLLAGRLAAASIGTLTATAGTGVATALTGHAAAASAGALTAIAKQMVSFSLTGMGMTPSAGALTTVAGTGVSTALTGQPAIASFGSLTIDAKQVVSTTLIGLPASAASGTLTVQAGGAIAVGLAGQVLTAAPGGLTVVAKQFISTTLTGQGLAAAPGDLTVVARQNIAMLLGGQSAATSAGILTAVVRQNITELLAGRSLAGTLGTLTVSAKINATALLTGQALTALRGDPSATAGAGVATLLAGRGIAGSLGSLTLVAKQFVSTTLAGRALAAAAGGLSVSAGGSIAVALAGRAAVASPGTLTVTAKQFASTVLAGRQISGSRGDLTVLVEVGDEDGLVSVWNGSAWVDKPAMVWMGSAWVQKPVKVWNGSAWV